MQLVRDERVWRPVRRGDAFVAGPLVPQFGVVLAIELNHPVPVAWVLFQSGHHAWVLAETVARGRAALAPYEVKLQ